MLFSFVLTIFLAACQPSEQQESTTDQETAQENNNQVSFDETYKQLEEISALTLKYQDRHTGSEGSKKFIQFLKEKLNKNSQTLISHPFELNGIAGTNITVDIKGDSDDIILIGAHYDSVKGSPGINDNGTGIAILMALAEKLGNSTFKPKKPSVWLFGMQKNPVRSVLKLM